MLKNLEKKFKDSKLNISKNFIYYIIGPIILMLIALIVVCTINFNLGSDFSGFSSVKIYVNNEEKIETTIYDLDKKEDYKSLKDKLETIFDSSNLKIISYRTTTITISDYDVYDGQAVEVVFKNNSKDSQQILLDNVDLREKIVAEFDYNDFDLAVSSVDFTEATSPYMFIVKMFAGITLGLLCVIIYMLLRKYRSLIFMMILQVALTVSLISICRIVVNFNVAVALLATFIISVLNCFIFINRQKNDAKTGKCDGLTNNQIADMVVKELSFKKMLAYILAILATLVFVCLSVPGVRNVALAVLVGLLATMYSSHFNMPALWATTKNLRKKKDK